MTIYTYVFFFIYTSLYIHAHTVFGGRGRTASRPSDGRATWNSTWRLATSGLPSSNRRPWEEKRLGERLGSGPFGRVWLPSKRIVLGRDAGAWAQKVIKMTARQAFRRDKDPSGGDRRKTSPLLEIALFLRHKTQKERKMTLAKRLLALKQKVRSIKLSRMINSWKHFVDSGLF